MPRMWGSQVEASDRQGRGILFKGSGFYETDYRSKSYRDGKQAAKDQKKAATESKSESKSESKPGSKPGSKSSGEKDKKKSD